MFAPKAEIYTVYERWRDTDADSSITLVREGFCIWAFLLHVVWLLYKRQWLGLLFFVPLYAGLMTLSNAGLLPSVAIALCQLGLQLWLGFIAHDLERLQLERYGYRLMDIVLASSPLLAEQRYLDRKHHHASTPAALQLA